MKKQLQLFLAFDDERRLSDILKSEIPNVRFLNGNVWVEKPDVKDGIEYCESGIVYLYAGDLDALPTMRRKDGRLEGPAAGCVVQILRPLIQDGVLLSGRVAAGFKDDDSAMSDFVSKVWNCVMKIGRLGVLRPDGRKDRNYLVGEHVKKMKSSNELRIADRAIGMFYELVSS
jgi:hypothetical protein